MRLEDRKINEIGMIFILIINLGYIFFGSTFAQLRMKFSFLDFPVFIGEIVLIVTTSLFFVKKFPFKKRLKPLEMVLAAYFLFVLYKAFSGYLTWGPLAFRDAALFYYPFFAILGYSFWTLNLWGNKTRRFCLGMIVLMLVFKQINMFWTFSLLLIGVIFSLQANSFKERLFFIVVIFFLAPYGALFSVFNRTIFLSTSIALVFLGFVLVFIYCKNRRDYFRAMVIGMLVLGWLAFRTAQTGIWTTMNINGFKTVTGDLTQDVHRGKCLFHPVGGTDKPDTIKEFWGRILDKVLILSSNTEPPFLNREPMGASVSATTNPTGEPLSMNQSVKQEPLSMSQAAKQEPISMNQSAKQEPLSMNQTAKQEPLTMNQASKQEPLTMNQTAKQEPLSIKKSLKQEPVVMRGYFGKNEELLLQNKKNDTVFRLIIWRDMFREYVHYKPLFGFVFGRPLYSGTLKLYGLNGMEDGDGWTGAHNSFFYMIYRSGIVGLAMVLSLILIWLGSVRDFYLFKDPIGILLCAILLSWLVSANFFLIFELPYTAIPIWTIWGITEKYRSLLIRHHRKRRK